MTRPWFVQQADNCVRPSASRRHVGRKLALQELDRVGPGDAEHAETRQQYGAQRLCVFVVHDSLAIVGVRPGDS